LLSGIVYQLSICYFLINILKVHIYPLHRYYLQQFLEISIYFLFLQHTLNKNKSNQSVF